MKIIGKGSSSKTVKAKDYTLNFQPHVNRAAANAKSKAKPADKDKPVAKVKTSKEAKVAKKAAKSSVKKDKPATITKGPNATHAINADTGKPVKLSASARKANAAYGTKTNSDRPPLQPAVNLDDPTFTPKASGPRNKGGKK
jgi:hypothetical protein